MIYFENKTVHFIGIGGIGMSAIAEALKSMGISVQGSNDAENANTIRLRNDGIPVFIGHDNPDNLKNADVVIISTAISDKNPELIEAKRLGLPIGHRAEMLAQLLRYKQGIAVAGTHGKTTTSSLISFLLEKGNFDPSFIVGGILNDYGTNSRVGKSNWLAVEADESDGSFLRLHKMISVVTNIDSEHMDYYQSFDKLTSAFELFLQTTSFYGFCVVCADHPVALEVAQRIKNRTIITYGLSDNADVQAVNIQSPQAGLFTFDVIKNGEKYENFKLPMFGKHNVQNALAAITVANRLGMTMEDIKTSLENFHGVQRRFTPRGQYNGALIFDDYAHHPEEIKATLRAAKDGSQGHKVLSVFQAHRYTRAKDLMDGFASSFNDADVVLVADIYAAGEEPIDGVTQQALFDKIKASGHPNVLMIKDKSELPDFIDKYASSGDLVIGLGAGDISKWMQELGQLSTKKE